jgi:phosphatidate cytidylyltransferase
VTSELARRVAFGIVAAPIAIGIVLAGGAALAALLAIAAALAASEFFRLARGSGLTPLGGLGVTLAGLVPLAVHARYLQLYDPDRTVSAVSVGALVVLLVSAVAIWARGATEKPLGGIGATLFGVAYTGGMLSFAYAIRYHEYAFGQVNMPVFGSTGALGFAVPAGGLLLLLPVFVTWASDTGAYAAGRAFGRHKLIPAVSPGKTVEGAIGGLVGAAIVGWLYVRYVLHPATALTFQARLGGVVLFAVVVSVAAQIGDLAESLLKREANVKNSSDLIPGHGGVLDRLDSLLFVLPVAYVLFGVMLTWAPS